MSVLRESEGTEAGVERIVLGKYHHLPIIFFGVTFWNGENIPGRKIAAGEV